MTNCIVWFQYDLRLQDNPALAVALEKHEQVFPLFVWNPNEGAPWSIGGASRVWLEQSLHSLEESLSKIGLRMSYFKGESADFLPEICKRLQIRHVYYNYRTEPALAKNAKKTREILESMGVEVEMFQAHTLFDFKKPPRNDSGGYYQIYGAFARRMLSELRPRKLISLPKRKISTSNPGKLTELPLSALGISGQSAWEKRLRGHWQIGENAAANRLSEFVDGALCTYAESRDLPKMQGTSLLSPHLKFGEISPFQIWHKAMEKYPSEFYRKGSNVRRFIDELIWREFSQYILRYSPSAASEPLRQEFKNFPWSLEKDAQFHAWCHGKTGFPLIDAGMRQLWETGWMHNRVRMLCASFLVKHLQKDWILGATWFWDTLVDADLANNSISWQWCAGSGVDAAPYFRIFNPILQSRKFDQDGIYIKKWVPELGALSAKAIHSPWTELNPRSIYPRNPIIEHEVGRARALDAYKKFRTIKAEL